MRVKYDQRHVGREPARRGLRGRRSAGASRDYGRCYLTAVPGASVTDFAAYGLGSGAQSWAALRVLLV